MSDWKSELEAMLVQTEAIAREAVARSIVILPPAPAEPSLPTLQKPLPEKIATDAIDWGPSEREQIAKRVESFRAHQRRVAREREDYAAATIARMRQL